MNFVQQGQQSSLFILIEKKSKLLTAACVFRTFPAFKKFYHSFKVPTPSEPFASTVVRRLVRLLYISSSIKMAIQEKPMKSFPKDIR